MDYNKLPDEARKYIRSIIECIDDGIFITDGEGNVIELNGASLGVQSRESIIGKNMRQLVDEGIYRDSLALQCIKEKRKITSFQHEETEILTTATPYIEDGKVLMVVLCERELRELEIIKEQLHSSEQRLEDYRSELEYFRSVANKEVDIVMESDEMQHVVELALTAAQYGSRVLIQGESGVGKEIVAKIVYKNSARKNAPFIAINCSAIPESLLESELFGYEKGAFTGASDKGKKGIFELANKGVLFLDEIGDISMNFQTKLLRVLQENEVMRIGGKEIIPIDVQVIVASNKSLAEKVVAGEFRSDLFYRLNTFPIVIPPLRARRRDIVPLVYLFADKFNNKYKTNKKFSLSSLNMLQRYQWPGNVRELENLVERIILTSREDIVTEKHVEQMLYFCTDSEEDVLVDGTLKEAVEHTEKCVIKKYMEQYKTPAELEKALGLSRATLNRKIMKYGLRNDASWS